MSGRNRKEGKGTVRNTAKIMAILPWVLVVLSVLLIFGLTLQDTQTTTNVSSTVQETVVSVTKTEASWWDDFKNFRRIGHIAEFFLLGASCGLAFKKKHWGVTFCLGVSVADQCLKALLPTREFEWIDLPFDFIGYILGILLAWGLIKATKMA